LLRGCNRFEEWQKENRGVYLDEDDLYGEEARLTDNLSTSARGGKLVSQRLRDFLEPLLAGHVQFLPLTLQKKDGSGIVDGYYLMHPLKMVDCLVIEKSDVVPIGSGSYQARTGMGADVLLSRSSIPEDVIAFKLAQMTGHTFLREDICQLLIDAEFTGLLFEEVRWSE